MVPARNLLRRHFDNYGCRFGDAHDKLSLISILPMDDEEHRRGSGNGEEAASSSSAAAAGVVGTSSRETDDWLRLGIGRSSGAAPVSEFPLFPARSLSSSLPSIPKPSPPRLSAATAGIGPPVIPLFPPHGLSYRPGVGVPWGYKNPMAVAAPPPPPPRQYSFRQYAPSERVVVTPPRRPQAGIWFLLQAAQHQVRVPFLPQISKSYLRINDGKMTVRLLIKYLVGKLGLDDESEVEITCRGQPLLPCFTLQHVRDSIWCLSAAVELLPDSRPTDHMMTLQYGRSGK